MRKPEPPPPRTAVPIATAAPEWRSSMSRAQAEPEPTLHFVTGLPRAGATVLMSVLHQNPRIWSAPVSGLGEFFHHVAVTWKDNRYHQASSAPPGPERVLRAMLTRYHDTDRPIVLDKQHMWVAAIPGLERVLQRNVRMIAMVRRIPDILASLESLRSTGPWPQGMADRAVGPFANVASRTAFYMDEAGFVGMPLRALQVAVQQGFGDRLLFVDYDRLVDQPHEQLARIYKFLGEEPFEHDLLSIEPLGYFDGTPFDFPTMFDVRPELGRVSRDPAAVLGRELVEGLNQPAPWQSMI